MSLEEEFRKACKEAEPLIAAELALAAEAIRRAEKISEQYGVPFDAGVSPISNTYEPESFEDKFGGLREGPDGDSDSAPDDYEPIWSDDLWDHAPNEYGAGWAHSAVC